MLARSLSIFILFFILLAGSTPAQDDLAQASRLFDSAETLRKSEKAESKREAIAKYEEAVLIFRTLRMREREATAYNNIGNTYLNLSEFENALAALEKSLAISVEINDRKLEIITLLNLGRTFRLMGRQPDAATSLERALAVSREANNKELEAAALNGLGATHYSTGDYQAALSRFEGASAIFIELGQPASLASLQNNMGLINRMLGNQDEAIDLYKRSLESFRTVKDKSGEADAMLNLSAIYADQFRTAEAMEYFNRALSIFREAGDRQREAVILNNIGVFFNNLGDNSTALEYYLRSAELARATGDRRQLASALKNLGGTYVNLHDLNKASDNLAAALEISRAIKDRINEAWVLNHIGLVHLELSEHEAAQRHFNEALTIFRTAGNRAGEARVLLNLGLSMRGSGHASQALDQLKQALGSSRLLSVPGEEAKILLNIARAERDLGKPEDAIRSVERAIQILESLRSTVPGQHLQTSFATVTKDSYDLHIDLLMQANGGRPSQDQIAKAFDTGERSRARSLLESLIESKAEIQAGVDPGLLRREISLRNKLNAKESFRIRLSTGKSNPKQLAAVEKEIGELVSALQQLHAQIRAASPGYAALVRPSPFSAAEIQRSILEGDTVLLEYAIGEQSSYLWALRPDSITGHQLPGRRDLESIVRRFRSLLTASSLNPTGESPAQRKARLNTADRDLARVSAELGGILLGPVAKDLGNARIVVVADGALQYVPFAALSLSVVEEASPVPAKFLVETNEIVYLPSATTLGLLRDTKPGLNAGSRNHVAVLADPIFTAEDSRVRSLAKRRAAPNAFPDSSKQIAASFPSELRADFSRLRFSRTEAQSISNLVADNREVIALDFAANIETVNSEAFRNARIIHFATHGIVNSNHPELSGVVLSLIDEEGRARDGFLRLHDIYNLRLGSSMVVLSACETALGKEIRGEGIVGLTRGFMFAGAPSVVASLWRVEDKATADLMRIFYKGMLKDGLPPAAALRSAQSAMIAKKGSGHPFYWAGFTLQGDWRMPD